MQPAHPGHPALDGAYCPGCGRHCPASEPTCKRGVAFGERLVREHAGVPAREPRLFDTLEEAESWRSSRRP
jgi:hypothetical protein